MSAEDRYREGTQWGNWWRAMGTASLAGIILIAGGLALGLINSDFREEFLNGEMRVTGGEFIIFLGVAVPTSLAAGALFWQLYQRAALRQIIQEKSNSGRGH